MVHIKQTGSKKVSKYIQEKKTLYIIQFALHKSKPMLQITYYSIL